MKTHSTKNKLGTFLLATAMLPWLTAAPGSTAFAQDRRGGGGGGRVAAVAAAVAVIQAVVVAARAAAAARIAVVPAAEAAAVTVARVVVAAGAAVVVAAAAAVDKVVATKTATVNLGIVPVTATRGIRVAAATIVVVARIKNREGDRVLIRESDLSRNRDRDRDRDRDRHRGRIVIVAVIEIVIATEIGIASTKALAFTIRRIMVGTGTAPTLMNRATETACSRAPAMVAEGRTMTLSALTSTGAALLADSSHCSPTGLTDRPIATALCAAIRRAIRTGSGTLVATAFTLSQQSSF